MDSTGRLAVKLATVSNWGSSYTSAAWVNAGAGLYASNGTASYPELTVLGPGGVFVAFADGGSGRATVARLAAPGGAWQAVGTAGFSAGAAQAPSLGADAGGALYVGLRDQGSSNGYGNVWAMQGVRRGGGGGAGRGAI